MNQGEEGVEEETGKGRNRRRKNRNQRKRFSEERKGEKTKAGEVEIKSFREGCGCNKAKIPSLRHLIIST